jgi:hypothetical protein
VSDAATLRARLGTLVNKRRVTLGLSVTRAARRAGIHRVTWASIEQGLRDTQEHNYGPVEQALGWAEGSIERILAGGQPALEGEVPTSAMDLGALVRMLQEVLNSKFSSDSKVSMIRDLVDEAASYVAVDDNANKRAPDSSTG